jgi:peroxiredoxin
MKRFLTTILGCSATVLIVGCQGSEPISLEIGDPAPAFSLPAVGQASGKITVDQLKGKIAILNFWSTTCSVCLAETEDLARVHDSGKAIVVGIALEDDADYVGRFVKARGIRYPVALGDEDTFTRFDGSAVPYTLVLDRSMVVRKRVFGRIDADDLARAIDEIERTPVALGSAQASEVASSSIR